jgi:RNA polymerase sigma-70 factor (ECF subfamily)
MANEPASTGAAAPPGRMATKGEPPLAPAASQLDPKLVNPKLDVDRLVREHQAGLWRYLRVLGCPAHEAEDLTQETFLAVLTKPFQDYNRQATAAYLRQVARNLFVTSRRRAVSSVELDEAEAAWLRWAAHDEGEELLAALRECLPTLSERARHALGLRFGFDAESGGAASRAQIAGALGLSEDGAKNLLQRAKQQLRECIERKLAGERRGV